MPKDEKVYGPIESGSGSGTPEHRMREVMVTGEDGRTERRRLRALWAR